MVALYHPHPAERFSEPAGNVGVDLAALAEDRPDGPERLTQRQSEPSDHQCGDPGHEQASLQQNDEYDQRHEHTADKLDQARAQKISDAPDVGHDTRDQYAGLVAVVVGNRQAANVLLNFAPKLGNEPLASLGYELRE